MATLTITIDLAKALPGATAGDFIDISNEVVRKLRQIAPTGGTSVVGTNVYTATKNSDHTNREQAGTPHATGEVHTITLTSVAVS